MVKFANSGKALSVNPLQILKSVKVSSFQENEATEKIQATAVFQTLHHQS